LKARDGQPSGGSNPSASADLTSTDGAHVACLSGPGPVAVSLVVSFAVHSRAPTRSATSARIAAVTCWYRFAIALWDHPMRSMAVRSGTPRILVTSSVPILSNSLWVMIC